MKWYKNVRADGRVEYTCEHGVGHGLHVHGCDGCCSRDDFPLSDYVVKLKRKDINPKEFALLKPDKKFIIIAGVCVIENKRDTCRVAQKLQKIMKKYPEIEFYFKASFDKANRTSGDSYRGVGIEEGREILELVQDNGIKVLTDVHCPHQAMLMMGMDALQIPAFLCRQTDLVEAIAETRRKVNIKKGQFLAPEDVGHIIKKIEKTGNTDIMITERGTCFGYHNLVVDYRSFIKLKKFGYPVIFDATHSQQEPSADGDQTGGSREYTVPMILGAVACGVDGIFMEVHENPPKAKSDSATSLYLDDVEDIVKKILKIRRALNETS